MRKIGFILMPLAVLTGAVGFFLRQAEISTVFDPQSGLATPGAPISLALMALSVLVVLLFFGLSFLAPNHRGAGFGTAFACGPFARTVLALCAIGMMFIGGGRLIALVIVGWISVFPLIWAIAAFFAGLCLLLMALLGPRGRNVAVISTVPAFFLCVWLIVLHIDHASDPVLLNYVYRLFALAFLLLSLYYIAGFAFRQAKVRRLTCSVPSAAYFTGLTLADGQPLYRNITLILLAVTALLYLLILTRNLSRPVWDVFPMTDEIDDEDEEMHGEETSGYQ